jgi:hypothetical protein
MDTLSSLTIKEGVGIGVGVYIGIDLLVLLFNITRNSGVGGCAEADWISTPFLICSLLKNECEEGSDTADCSDLGRWKKYASKKNGKDLPYLCHDQVNKVYEDAVAHNIVMGFNATQLIAYVIVPTITILSILYGLLSTTMNKGEWTFWILIATVIFTGLTSISYNTDASIIPTHENPLEYVTSKLNLGVADELDYSFISRKQSGEECLIKGTVVGAGAITPPDQPPSYSGTCSQSDVPF